MAGKKQGKKKGEATEKIRTSLTVGALKRAFADNLFYVQGRSGFIATVNDYYMALSFTVRDRMLNRFIQTIHEVDPSRYPRCGVTKNLIVVVD